MDSVFIVEFLFTSTIIRIWVISYHLLPLPGFHGSYPLIHYMHIWAYFHMCPGPGLTELGQCLWIKACGTRPAGRAPGRPSPRAARTVIRLEHHIMANRDIISYISVTGPCPKCYLETDCAKKCTHLFEMTLHNICNSQCPMSHRLVFNYQIGEFHYIIEHTF